MCLFLLIVVHCIVNFYWLRLDEVPHDGDPGGHLMTSFILRRDIERSWNTSADLISFLQSLQHMTLGDPQTAYGPILYILPTVFNLVSVEHFFFNARFFTNTLFLIILVLGTFLSGACLFDKKTGLFAAFLVSFFSGCYGYARQFGFEFGLAAFFSLAFFLLASGWYKRSFFKAMWTGVFFGLGFLIKPQFLFFLLFPFAYAFYKDYCTTKNHWRTTLLALIIVSISGAFAISFYGHALSRIYRHFHVHVFGLYPFFKGYKGDATFHPTITDWFSFKSSFFYVIALIYDVGIFYALLCLYSGVRLFIERQSARFLIIGSMAVPYLIYTVISVKWMRYFFPVVFLVALVIAWGVCNIKRPLIRISIVGSIFLYSLTFFVYESFYKERDWPDRTFIIGPDHGYPITHRPVQKEKAILTESEITHMQNIVQQKGSLALGIGGRVDETGSLVSLFDELCKSFSRDFNMKRYDLFFLEPDDLETDLDYFYTHLPSMNSSGSTYQSKYTVVSRVGREGILLRKK